MIEEVIKREVESIISKSIDEEIKDRTIAFYKELTERKDQYIAEVMKGIRIAHEYDPQTMYMDYRIMFINRYAVEPHIQKGASDDEHRVKVASRDSR